MLTDFFYQTHIHFLFLCLYEIYISVNKMFREIQCDSFIYRTMMVLIVDLTSGTNYIENSSFLDFVTNKIARTAASLALSDT